MNESHWTTLHLAARRGHTDIAKLLLAHGADVEAVDKIHRAALPLAVCAAFAVFVCIPNEEPFPLGMADSSVALYVKAPPAAR